jgi:DNA-binding beta-propeller fold protein YncE
MAKRVLVVLTAPLAMVGCHLSGEDLPSDPPTSVTMVASGGFTSPSDAVASLDGSKFFFAAYDTNQLPGIFVTSSEPGSSASVLANGDPLAAPFGLVMSCDGGSLYIGDIGNEYGAILTTATTGGPISDLGVVGVRMPAGLAMGPDCKSIYATGRDATNQPALFKIALTGGDAKVVWAGDPLQGPMGVHVDSNGTAWVMDHLAVGNEGEGVLWSIANDGSAPVEVVSALHMGTPGGVSLTAGGGTAVMPTLDKAGHGQLTSVDIATGEKTQIAAPMIDPAGLRTARQAGVFAVVDSEGGAIYRAE